MPDVITFLEPVQNMSKIFHLAFLVNFWQNGFMNNKIKEYVLSQQRQGLNQKFIQQFILNISRRHFDKGLGISMFSTISP